MTDQPLVALRENNLPLLAADQKTTRPQIRDNLILQQIAKLK
jgi:hypothetical protein